MESTLRLGNAGSTPKARTATGLGNLFVTTFNDARQVVGSFYNAAIGQSHAFITGPNGVGMTDLNSLVDSPAGVVLTDAFGINNMGQAIAGGTSFRGDVSIVPESESFALMLTGLVLMGFLVRRKQKG